ncbi:aldehyde dehydrogenase family protein [Pseudomonas sp. LS-2]|uniref:aldehyde dehydrogenase family protein n=1 Tax=Pseudomonas sp. LS-2 TaxID=2315859 RepID=UPI000E7299C2|nr:aldehyde dehydrogenase family protein [Pseudomonas sp. LS-2]RJX77841.1 aldehyde dehydrogenase family protein [Pseudomonas sp. LS-2]
MNSPDHAATTHPFYINGQWRLGSSNEVDQDFNPATLECIGLIAQASPADVEDAISAAYAARLAWADVLVGDREALLLKAADIFLARADELRDLLIAETGSTFLKAPWEISYAVACLRSAAACTRQAYGQTFPACSPGQIGMTTRSPLGVIAGIAPFNSPLLLSMKKIAFALAAGNTFILKPSELAPLICLKIAEVFEEAGLPAGVFSVLPGSASIVGERLVSDPRIRMVTFTGSNKVGRLIAAEAGKHMKKVCLEMGGKSPLVVLADADLDYAVDAAAFGVFFHQGQVCMANSRIIVEDSLYETFCKAFAAKAKTIKVGDPRDPATVIGPLIRPQQCTFIKGQLEDALGKGARLLAGGSHEGPYFQATVLADVDPTMAIYDEESFGPVTTIYRADSFEHAVALANDTQYGLSAAIITNDLQKAMAFSQRSHAGMVHINDTTISDEPHIAFGGTQASGFGREGGMASMDEMSEVKWITVQMGKREFPF